MNLSVYNHKINCKLFIYFIIFVTLFMNVFIDFFKIPSTIKYLNDSNVRDILSYQLLQTSKVSYNYELLNFMYTNPLGETVTWYNSTVTLKSFINLAKKVTDEFELLHEFELSYTHPK